MRILAARSIDRYLPEDVRAILEERFWHTVEEKSTLEASSRDRTILGGPDTHPALFSDHGVVHARDVAAELFAREWFRPYEPGELENVLAQSTG